MRRGPSWAGAAQDVSKRRAAKKRRQVVVDEDGNLGAAILPLNIYATPWGAKTSDESRLLHRLGFPAHSLEFRAHVGIYKYGWMVLPQKI